MKNNGVIKAQYKSQKSNKIIYIKKDCINIMF